MCVYNTTIRIPNAGLELQAAAYRVYGQGTVRPFDALELAGNGFHLEGANSFFRILMSRRLLQRCRQ